MNFYLEMIKNSKECKMQAQQNETGNLQELTRRQLLELEREKKTKLQLWLDLIIWLLPFAAGVVAILEYTQIPDNSMNRNPQVYLVFLILLEKGMLSMIHIMDLFPFSTVVRNPVALP